MWTALRALEENSAIRRRMAERSKGHKWQTLAGEYERQARDSEERAALIREVLVCDDIDGRADADFPRRPDPEIPGVNTYGGEGNGERGNGKGSSNGKGRRGRTGKKTPATSRGGGAALAAANPRPSTKSSKSAAKTRSKSRRA
jgi:hypothetical protein